MAACSNERAHFLAGATDVAFSRFVTTRRGSGALVAATFLAGCVLTSSLTDLTGGHEATALYKIGGTVTGLAGATVALNLNGEGKISVTSDGPFLFPRQIPTGGVYIVSVVSVTDGRTCIVKHGEGHVVRTDVGDIAVECPSSNAKLSGLTLSVAPLMPVFSQEVVDYAAQYSPGFFALDAPVTMTATAESPAAAITVDGVVATSGKPVTLRGVVNHDAGAPDGGTGLHDGANTVSVVVTAEDGATRTAYRVVVTSRAQEAYVKASNTGGADLLGTSIAVSSDGNTLAVGGPEETTASTGVNGEQHDASQAGAGAVYVYRRSGRTWQQEAYLKASTTQPGRFGASVALSSDGSTLAVGASAESSRATGINGDQGDRSMSNAGAVYVFRRAQTTWSQEAYVKPSTTRATSFFGHAVTLSSDGNTLAVGAPEESSAATGIDGNQSDTSARSAGAAYVFARAGTTWRQEAYVKASNTREGSYFGRGIALSNDGNTLAIGSELESSAATGIDGNQSDTSSLGDGAVYVFSRNSATWKQDAYLKASNARAKSHFGVAVALSADGRALAVGASYDSSGAAGVDGTANDTSAPSAGAAYLFRRNGTSWIQQRYFKPLNPRTLSGFGGRVALSASGTRLAVGAQGESTAVSGINATSSDTTASESGAVYAFVEDVPATTWRQTAFIKASNTRRNARFGSNLALSADASTLAVGSPGEAGRSSGIDGDQSDGTVANSGAAYIFR